jgi:hypothetical protein
MKTIATKNDKSVRIRFPAAVLKKLDETAAIEGRSRNTEVIKRLGDSLGIKRKLATK